MSSSSAPGWGVDRSDRVAPHGRRRRVYDRARSLRRSRSASAWCSGPTAMRALEQTRARRRGRGRRAPDRAAGVLRRRRAAASTPGRSARSAAGVGQPRSRSAAASCTPCWPMPTAPRRSSSARAIRGLRGRGRRHDAHFEDGSEARGDVLIGADGIVSAVRRKLTGKGPPEFPPYAGYTIWHAIIAHADDDVPPRRLHAAVRPRTPLRALPRSTRARLLERDRLRPAGRREDHPQGRRAGRFGDYRAPVPALIERPTRPPFSATTSSAASRSERPGAPGARPCWATRPTR